MCQPQSGEGTEDSCRIPYYASGHDLIAEKDIDIVLNLTVPAVHSEYNPVALKAGKHVYTETPLGSDLESAREIMAPAKGKNLYVGCAPDLPQAD
ncbi:MAG: Gfo/Idh/MocA family oxidoreductase [Spirochaetales bacterium]|nr:Gfo/Idh/MocA family oxidoreductase [Spirochaetales bacterium]